MAPIAVGAALNLPEPLLLFAVAAPVLVVIVFRRRPD